MSSYHVPQDPEYLQTPRRTETTAWLALICAIGSWVVVPVILAVVALLLAQRASRVIDSSANEGSGGQLTGSGLVRAARIVAWLNLLVAAMVIAFGAAFAVAIAIGR